MAVYQDKLIYGRPVFNEIVINDGQKVEFYVELPNNKHVRLSELSQKDVEGIFRKVEARPDDDMPQNVDIYVHGDSGLTFHDGKLDAANFTSGAGFRFSVNENGPYSALPFDEATMIRIFGEPLRWRRAGHYGPAW